VEEELTQMDLLKEILDENIEKHPVLRDPELFKNREEVISDLIISNEKTVDKK
jgi:hypothetical protein